MTTKNPEYDFNWCPGCANFGVRRALAVAFEQRQKETGLPAENNVVVAGIGCSGNIVHLLEGPQPYGFHGVHGRTLPVALGIRMARPDLNVVVVAGDGDFLSIGMEHIAPQAARNLNITAIVIDNGIYGLTKGQASPTSNLGQVTSSTPYGKIDDPLDPLRLYLSLDVPFVASGVAFKIQQLSSLIKQGMDYPGFAIVHVKSPCVTYNNTIEHLRGNPAKGIQGLAWDIPPEHDPSDLVAAFGLVHRAGIPLGILYQHKGRRTFTDRLRGIAEKASHKSVKEVLDSYAV